ncbi:MAG: penicillin-binding protein 2 [Endomicrobia bacterium]|nr:penicillin-binding protein 2 [Endomicrobiia bacterium]MCL2799121.1 penicillin-binding protein 2 [Endomicrobiia bacterium]
MPNKNNKQINRVTVLISVILAGFFFIFLKLAFIQIVKYSEINKSVEKMIRRENVETPKRGDIIDSNGRILATSVIMYTLYIDPQEIKKFDKVKSGLSRYGINIKQKNLKEFGNTAYVPLAYNLDYETVRKIKDENIDRGIGFEGKYARQYPEGRLLSHILGIVGDDGNGLSGIEKICNSYLYGESVVTEYKKYGKKMISDKPVDKAKIRGRSVELTIDKKIQFIVEQELGKAFADNKAKRAFCIVQKPDSGEILAMVSFPNFDSSDKIKDIEVLKNLAISYNYEPGSTFKIIAIAAALEENKIKPSEKFFLEDGKYKIGAHNIRDDHKIKGIASVYEIMEQSSNIGMVKIAQKLGRPLFYEYIRKFGFFFLTGIDLNGEERGILAEEKKWNNLSLPTISFGQGISVTGIQLINAFSATVNGGVLMKPIIIKNIEGMHAENSDFGPKKIRRVISEETSAEMRKILRNTVDKGTGKSAKIDGYSVGGKTGTAQKIDETKQYSKKHYISSFCGFFPVSKPEIVILVVIDEPKGDYYASSVAAPVFARIAERIAEYLNIPKDDVKKTGLTANKKDKK